MLPQLMSVATTPWRNACIDSERATIAPFADMLEAVLSDVEEDADALGCADQMHHIRAIARHGTSADRQLRLYAALTRSGATPAEALQRVVQMLITETAAVGSSHAGRQANESRLRETLRP